MLSVIAIGEDAKCHHLHSFGGLLMGHHEAVLAVFAK